MIDFTSSVSRLRHFVAPLMLLALFGTTWSFADNVPLLNGLQLRGEIGTTSRIGEVAGEFSPGGSIIIVDDGLRRTFLSAKQLAAPIIEEVISEDVIRIDQNVAGSVDIIRGVGRPLQVSPFNSNGRRVIVLAGPDGPRELIQGITKITPTYCVLETLTMSRFNVQWESRIATAAIPREVLSSLIQSQSDPSNPNDRMKVVQLLIEAERYRDAVTELEQFLDDFPDLTDKRPLADLLRQSYARQILGEIRLRRDVGQPRQAAAMLRQFPTVGIAGDLLGQVLEMQQEQERTLERIAEIRTELEQLAAQARQGTTLEADQLASLDAILAEIRRDLSVSNVVRLAGFYQFRDDEAHTIDQKLAFAVSGWLLGEADLTGNLPVAISLVDTRRIVQDYLVTRLPHERQELLAQLGEQEGADVATLAKLVSQLTGPIGRIDSTETPTDIPGCFEIQGEGERPIRYWVQLPPEYDPYRRYPCIVTLNGDREPLDQIEWWAGSYDARAGVDQRLGQATRQGYIVIAPQWRRADQWVYEYSPTEHARVLDAVRDARRRFAIDTDRTFLTGHSEGGDAAWDIALSHPDFWAGFIGIAASADKYVNHYFSNASGTLPMYFVHGEYDHARMASNKADWNRYLRPANKSSYDVLIVTYQGRGHEHFQEEILNIFDWMRVHRRVTVPDELDVRVMRPWDNFFWWLEVFDLPAATQVIPAEWPVSGRSAGVISGKVDRDRNLLQLPNCAASRATVWLYPGLLDFERQMEFNFKGERSRLMVSPSAEVLLEDVRSRAEHQHPFWARVDLPQRRN